MFKNKSIIITATILSILLILIIGVKVYNSNKDKIIKNQLVEVTQKFYSEYYYDTFNDKGIFKEFEKNGIRLTINDLYELNLLEKKDYLNYDLDSSQIIITPIKPYEKESIEVTIKLVRKRST